MVTIDAEVHQKYCIEEKKRPHHSLEEIICFFKVNTFILCVLSNNFPQNLDNIYLLIVRVQLKPFYPRDESFQKIVKQKKTLMFIVTGL